MMHGPDRSPSLGFGVAVSLAAAAAATGLDALLLQIRRGFFTGGFLAIDSLTGSLDRATFLVLSLFIDLCAVGAAVGVGLWLAGRLGLNRHLGAALAAALGLAPIIIKNIVDYQLQAFLGDAFDLQLMFNLAGRNPGEITAVSSTQLMRLALLLGGVAVIVAAGLWLGRARLRTIARREAPLSVPARQAFGLAVMLLVLGAAVTAAGRIAGPSLDNGLRRKPAGAFLSALVNLATDFDRDGFGLLGRPPDPGLFDARVQPYALEVPGNGVDEDGVGGDLGSDAVPYLEEPVSAAPWASKPDVVLIVLESFRADAFGAELGGRAVTPTLDALARRGLSSARAYSHNGYTIQSRQHIFRGSVAHADRGQTLLDDFRAQGYQTAYFSAQDESFGGVSQGVGFKRADVAYDARNDRERRYSDFTTPGSLAVSHAVLGERVSEFLHGRRTTQPLFLYVNFHDTHYPYHHRQIDPLLVQHSLTEGDIVPERAQQVREAYLNTAANVDRAIGRLLSDVQAVLGREPAVVVLADHGESLFDEGFLGHGYALNDAQTRIPLIVANLEAAVPEPFGQADLRPMLARALSAAGVPGAVPTIQRDQQKRVFQYLGTIERPAQIGFVTMAGRILYDLRSRRAKIHGADWRTEGGLDPADRALVVELVQTWERMLLSRKSEPIS